jgi:hypothetical protein
MIKYFELYRRMLSNGLYLLKGGRIALMVISDQFVNRHGKQAVYLIEFMLGGAPIFADSC